MRHVLKANRMLEMDRDGAWQRATRRSRHSSPGALSGAKAAGLLAEHQLGR